MQPQQSARAAYAARKAAEEAAAPPLLRAPTPPPLAAPAPPRKRRKADAAASAPATPAASRRESAVSSGADETSADEELAPTPSGSRKKGKTGAEAALCAPGSWTPAEAGGAPNWACEESCEGRGKALVLAMREGETLIFTGTAQVDVLEGSVTLLGARLGPGKRATVFAPKCSPLPVLTAQSSAKAGKASGAKRWADDIPACLRSVEFTAYVRVEALLGTGVELLGRVCPVAGLDPFGPVAIHEPTSASVSGGTAAFQAQQAAGFHPILAPARSVSPLSLSPSWKRTLDSLASAPGAASLDGNSTLDLSTPQALLVRGPKRAGKSTFGRLALSALLSRLPSGGRVAWLDADLGQPEYGPPGLVSLHVFVADEALRLGPGWTAARAPLRAHFIGAPTPRDDPHAYIAALEDLLVHFTRHVRDSGAAPTPLIVNTQGWVKGLGADLAARLEHLVVPTIIFDLQPCEDFDSSSGAGVAQEVAPPYQGAPYLDAQGGTLGPAPIVVPLSSAAPTGAARLTAADGRVLNLLAHLHAVYDATGVPRWDFTRTLCERRPLRVDVALGLRAGVHVVPFGATVSPALALAALNGSIAAIVRTEQSSAAVTPIPGLAEPWASALSHPAPTAAHSTCLGLALVRAVAPQSGTLDLLTSLPPTSLALTPTQSLALLKGALDTPLWAALDTPHVAAAQAGLAPPALLAGTRTAQVPYVEWPEEKGEATALGAGKRRVRRNLMRKGQRG